MDLDKVIKSRRSIKKFSSKKPDWRDIIDCLDSLQYAPMAGNNFTLKAILVDDSKKIEEISEACQQDFIKKAQYVVVICSNPLRTLNAYGKEGEIYLRQQAGAAIENFLLKITEAGLATCWIGFFVEEQIKSILKIPEKINIEAVFPVGYETQKPATKKIKSGMDRIMRFNNYEEKRMNPLKKFNV